MFFTPTYILTPAGPWPRRKGRKRGALFPSPGPYGLLTHPLRILNLLGVYGDCEQCSTSTTLLASLSRHQGPQLQENYKYFSESCFFSSSLHLFPSILTLTTTTTIFIRISPNISLSLIRAYSPGATRGIPTPLPIRQSGNEFNSPGNPTCRLTLPLLDDRA